MEEKNSNNNPNSFKNRLLEYGNQKTLEEYEQEKREEARRRALQKRREAQRLADEAKKARERELEGADVEDAEVEEPARGTGRTYSRGNAVEEAAEEAWEDEENAPIEEDLEASSEEDEEDEEEKARRSEFGARLLKWAFAIILGLILYAVFHSKCELKTVIVSGSNIYTESEIWSKTTKGPQDMYAPFYALTVAKDKGKNIPFIEKIDVDWKLSRPDTVELTVYEKRVIGCVYVMGGYFYFDRDGLVCEYSEMKVEKVPLVEGLDFSSIVVGKKLQVQKDKYYDVLLNLTLLLEDSELEVDSIRFLYDDSVVLTIGETEVKAGKREKYDIVVNALPRIIEALEDKNVILKMENYSESNTTVVGSPKE